MGRAQAMRFFPPARALYTVATMHKVIERILNLLAFLLTAERPVTADEIRPTVAGYGAGSDDAFHRMFERDKDLLRQLGIPLTLRPMDAWEVEYGYVVPQDQYQLPDAGLTDEERAALWLAAQAVRLGGQAQGPGAIFKLGGTPFAGAGEPLTANLGQDSGELAVAFAAVTERRILSFDYRDRPRRLQPYGLVHRRGHWYLVGTEVDKDEIRAYRVDRARRLRSGDEPGAFRRPKGFKAAEAIPDAPWEAGGDDIVARVLFDPEVAWWAERQLTRTAEVVETSDGGLDVTLRVANPDALIGWLLAFEDNVELLEPPDLRERIVARVKGEL